MVLQSLAASAVARLVVAAAQRAGVRAVQTTAGAFVARQAISQAIKRGSPVVERTLGLDEDATEEEIDQAISQASPGELQAICRATMNMPHRDPQTGQFVSGPAGGEAPVFEELDVINWRHQLIVEAGIAADFNGPEGGFETGRLELDNIISRGEVAEIVGITRRVHADALDDADIITGCFYEVRESIARDPDEDHLELTASGDPAANMRRSGDNVFVDDPGLLYYDELRAWASFNNATTGAGGSSTGEYYTEHFFPAQMGLSMGPIVTRNDELQARAGVNVKNAHDINSEYRVNVTMYLDFWEFDDVSELARIIGI